MSSIGSSINSINRSLLDEIQSFSSSTTSTGTTTSTSSTAAPDKIDFSQAGDLFQQLQQLQKSNPDEFKQVLTDAVSKLKDAASQQTDPHAAAFLNKVADGFQKAADTGDISSIHPLTGGGGGGSHVHGHHGGGHHGGGAAPAADSDSDSSTTDSTDPFSSLVSSLQTQSQNSLFNLLDFGQTSSTSTDLLSSVLGQSSSDPSSNNGQIEGLLNSFVTNNG